MGNSKLSADCACTHSGSDFETSKPHDSEKKGPTGMTTGKKLYFNSACKHKMLQTYKATLQWAGEARHLFYFTHRPAKCVHRDKTTSSLISSFVIFSH